MTFPIYIPVPFYNLLTMIVSTAVLLWGMRAIKRLVRIVVVRIAAINNSFVMIKGVGHNLINLEGASQHHMQSIIHTRPTNPPKQMSVLYIPFVVKSTVITTPKNIWTIEVQIWSATKAYVMILAGFKLSQFKLHHEKLLKEMSLRVMKSIKGHSDNIKTLSFQENDFTKLMRDNNILTNVSQPLVIEENMNHVTFPLFASAEDPRYA